MKKWFIILLVIAVISIPGKNNPKRQIFKIINHNIRGNVTFEQKQMLTSIIWDYGYKRHKIDPLIIIALISTESEWAIWAKNKRTRALGLLQHLPKYWPDRRKTTIRSGIIPEWYMKKYGTNWDEPVMNVACAIRHLTSLRIEVSRYLKKRKRMDKWFEMWIVSYYSGFNGSKRYLTRPLGIQKKYIKRFNKFYRKLR